MLARSVPACTFVRVLAAAIGLLGALRPRTLLDWHARSRLLGYRNVNRVEPKGWLVALTRVISGLVAAVALRGLVRDGDGRGW